MIYPVMICSVLGFGTFFFGLITTDDEEAWPPLIAGVAMMGIALLLAVISGVLVVVDRLGG